MDAVIAIGVDPGTRHLGWGIVARTANRLSHVEHGVIHLDVGQPLALRLEQLEREFALVLSRHRPAVGSVETLFFHKDAQAAAKLGHARGVILLLLARAGIEVAEYAPAHVKRTVTGRGQADKRQVALMIRAMLGLTDLPAGDAADALALAVTHLRRATVASPLFARRAGSKRSARAALSALIRAQRAKPA